MQQTRRDGGGLATNPREWHSGASGAVPTKPCPYPHHAGREPRAEPGADPARARREQQQGKAAGAELSPGTRRVGRGRTRQALEKKGGNGMFACISSRNFQNSFETVPSTSSLGQAVMGRKGRAAHKEQEPAGGPGEPRVTVELSPGRGHGGFPGAAPTLRHPTAPAPPVCPFPNPNLSARRIKMIQTQGMDPARGVSSCPEHDPQLLQNFPPGAAFAPHQRNKCKSNSDSFGRDNYSLIACPYNSSHK